MYKPVLLHLVSALHYSPSACLFMTLSAQHTNSCLSSVMHGHALHTYASLTSHLHPVSPAVWNLTAANKRRPSSGHWRPGNPLNTQKEKRKKNVKKSEILWCLFTKITAWKICTTLLKNGRFEWNIWLIFECSSRTSLLRCAPSSVGQELDRQVPRALREHLSSSWDPHPTPPV